jgi:nicotinate-nucleotide adenylyltransferase
MTAHRRLGVIGGTFDPIHVGHLAAARAAATTVGLDEVVFVPSHEPPHRAAGPRASSFHRFAMVSLAVAPEPGFLASDLELLRPGLSFTADTLRTLHAEGRPASHLFFIIGTDAFAEIATWHDYPALLGLAHFVVISRPGRSFDGLRERLPQLADRMCEMPGGQAGEKQAASPHIFLVHADTPDVSSTEIREKAVAGGEIAGLVPAGVEEHIRRHQLYGHLLA